MTKKTKRARRQERRQGQRAKQTRELEGSTRSQVRRQAETAPQADLTREYAYVFADLRKIAVIAAGMFALLFILAFTLS